MQVEQKIIALSKRWDHHTESGGYDRLGRDLTSQIVKPPQNRNFFLSEQFSRKILRKILPSSQYVNRYSPGDLVAELRILFKTRRSSFHVVHALYADDQLNLILRYKNLLQCALVGTYHLPVESAFVKRVTKAGKYNNRLNALDSAIVVSKSMISDYEKWIGKGKVFFVPHGIDTEVFCPSTLHTPIQSGLLNVLVVGGHGRDWDTVFKIIEASQQKNLNIKYHAVVPANIGKQLNSIPYVRTYTGIPETELITLYRDAQVVLLPVRFATANNSLLEAISCGSPVISTNIGGIPDYLDESCGWLFPPGDVKSTVQLLEFLLTNPDVIRSKSEAARIKAMKFDWKNVAKQIFQVYEFAYDHWKKN